MSQTSAAVAVYATHDDAEAAIKSLQKSGFDMKKLSIVGKDFQTEEHAVGYYNTGDRVKFWGKKGAFWGGLAGILFSSAFLVIPIVGHIIVLGPLVTSIIGGLEGAAVAGSTSALFAALVGWGIPKDSVIQYENDVKAGKFLVLAQGTRDEVARAKDLLGASKPASVALHAT
jgi:Heat induced stress protein YflT